MGFPPEYDAKKSVHRQVIRYLHKTTAFIYILPQNSLMQIMIFD